MIRIKRKVEQIKRRQISSEKRLGKILAYLKEGYSSRQLSTEEGSCSKSRAAAVSGACRSWTFGMSADGVKEEKTDGCSTSEQKSNSVNVSWSFGEFLWTDLGIVKFSCLTYILLILQKN